MKNKTVCVVGLGYVGLPLAEAFSKHLKTIGFDVDNDKIGDLNNEANIEFTSDPSKIKQADFVLICVPTPVTKSKEPDLRYVKSAAEIVGQHLKKGSCRSSGEIHNLSWRYRRSCCTHFRFRNRIRTKMRCGF